MANIRLTYMTNYVWGVTADEAGNLARIGTHRAFSDNPDPYRQRASDLLEEYLLAVNVDMDSRTRTRPTWTGRPQRLLVPTPEGRIVATNKLHLDIDSRHLYHHGDPQVSYLGAVQDHQDDYDRLLCAFCFLVPPDDPRIQLWRRDG
jgi:hypothetical protein